MFFDSSAQYSVRLRPDPVFQNPRNCSAPDCHHYDLRFDNARIPKAKTTYLCKVIEFPKGGPFHLVSSEGLIDNSKYVHHIILYGGSSLAMRNIPRDEYFGCEGVTKGIFPISGWAKGAKPLDLPTGVGIQLGEWTQMELAIVQIHYDNVNNDQDVYDSSGLRIYLTKKLYPTNAGLLVSGTEDINLAPRVQRTQVASSCSMNGVLSFQVSVFGFSAHAHRFSRRVWVEIIRSGNTTQMIQENGLMTPPRVGPSVSTFVDTANSNQSVLFGNYRFDFDDQEITLLDTPITIFTNDTIMTYCEYDTQDSSANVTFSLSSDGEMCNMYMITYPVVKQFSFCAGAFSRIADGKDQQMMEEIPTPMTLTWFPFNIFFVILAYWTITNLFYLLFSKLFIHRWADMKEDQRKSVAYYFVPTVIFSIALGILLTAKMFVAVPLYADMVIVRGVAVVVCSAYTYEMSYRNLRGLLVFHHLLTILITIWLLFCTVQTGNFAFFRIGFFWLLHALTEQSTFVGLFLHKLGFKKWAMYVLYFATVQVFVTKMVVNGFMIAVWYVEILPFTGSSFVYSANTVVFPVVIMLLGWVQIFDATVTYSIAQKNRRALAAYHFESISAEIIQ
jgi:hypothetical protein